MQQDPKMQQNARLHHCDCGFKIVVLNFFLVVSLSTYEQMYGFLRTVYFNTQQRKKEKIIIDLTQ